MEQASPNAHADKSIGQTEPYGRACPSSRDNPGIGTSRDGISYTKTYRHSHTDHIHANEHAIATDTNRDSFSYTNIHRHSYTDYICADEHAIATDTNACTTNACAPCASALNWGQANRFRVETGWRLGNLCAECGWDKSASLDDSVC